MPVNIFPCLQFFVSLRLSIIFVHLNAKRCIGHLMQCRLIGKAQEACSSLSLEDGLVYEKVKNTIFHVYELLLEAYRQRFRNLKKNSDQTQLCKLSTNGRKELPFPWQNQPDSLSSVRDLMLVEEFKNCVPERTVVYLKEQKLTNLQHTATLADEFILTHRNVFPRCDSLHRDSNWKVGDTQPVVGNVSQPHVLP